MDNSIKDEPAEKVLNKFVLFKSLSKQNKIIAAIVGGIITLAVIILGFLAFITPNSLT